MATVNKPPAGGEQTELQKFLDVLWGTATDVVGAAGGTVKEKAAEAREWAAPKIRKGNWWLRAVVIGLVLWPLVMMTISFVATSPVIATVALIIPSATLLVLLLRYPLISAAAAFLPAGRRVIGYLFLVAAVELGAGVYLAIVPVDRAPELIPLRVLVVVTLGLLVLGGTLTGRKNRTLRNATWILFAILIGITVVTYFGGVGEFVEKVESAARAVGDKIEEMSEEDPPTVQGVIETGQLPALRVTLQGPGVPVSIGVALEDLPAHHRCFFFGPSGTVVHFEDGTSGPITKNYGVKLGTPAFSGPAGEVAGMQCQPKNSTDAGATGNSTFPAGPICPGGSIRQEIPPGEQSITLPLQEDCWSPVFTVAPSHWFRVDPTECMDLLFYDGQLFGHCKGEQPRWLGDDHYPPDDGFFQVRGIGKAVITSGPK